MPDPIAVVGQGMRFPGARTPDDLWNQVINQRTAFRPVPADRWPVPVARVFEAGSPRLDKVYVTYGAFLEPSDLPEPPASLSADRPEDPLFHLTATIGAEAWHDGVTAGLSPRRVGVALGNLFLPTETNSAWGRRCHQDHEAPATMGPDRWSAHGPAQWLAQSLGLEGGAQTVDAACASSLYALGLAMHRLWRGEVDAMLAGGVSRPDCFYTQMGFCQLRALSRGGAPRPLDARADGMLVGEGGAIFLLKRLADAVRDGDYIHGLLHAVGLSNDRHGSLLAPTSEGQLRAMRAAYAAAYWRPADVDYIECHATGTPVGDRTELQSLLALHRDGTRRQAVALGSVKANLGHTLTAAGAAGLAKVLLALRHRTLPPQPNFERWLLEDRRLEAEFTVPAQPEPWDAPPGGGARRAAVNAFGFGGTNAHLLASEWRPSALTSYSLPPESNPAEEPIVVPCAQVCGGTGAPVGEQALVSFGIPPVEIAEMVDQQKTMLGLALELQHRANLPREEWANTAVVIGLEQPEEPLYYSYRWTLPLDKRAAAGPALSADRTLGSLGSIVASRVSRLLGCGAASFAMSAGPEPLRRLRETAITLLASGARRVLVGWLPFAAQSDALCRAWRESFPQAPSLEPSSSAFLALLEPSQASATELPPKPAVKLTYDQCLEFARGSAACSLGQDFAGLDQWPMRVRLPDVPLMLVDRVTALQAEPLTLKPGRIVTEHDVNGVDWYLDGGRMPASISIESGQADLLLVGYLGIDNQTKGQAVYRLLDAQVTFHRGLPRPDETARYDIRITRFQDYGATHLFFFQFDATIAGKPFLTMRHGCAGFFKDRDLRAGEGLVLTKSISGRKSRARSWIEPHVPIQSGRLGLDEVASLRRGELGRAFGAAFANVVLRNALPLPVGRLALIDEIDCIEPTGGRFDRGVIRSTLEITPDAWHLVCHFKDDPVMPGTLMYECCLQTLRVWLLRAGFISDDSEAVAEPVIGVTSRLKCRGQVIPKTKAAQFEIHLKETGFNPSVYALADAILLADGKPIVHIEDLSLQFTGATKENIDAFWERRSKPTGREDFSTGYGRRRLLESAIGRPSKAFGPAYAPFDDVRYIARLPSPPYLFMDRIETIDARYMTLKEGARIIAAYDVPRDGWYFDAAGSEIVPFAVLLECALQPCGWLAAFQGSALSMSEDLAFRNLGGVAHLHHLPGRTVGTLRTEVRATKIVQAANMILQHFAFTVRIGNTSVYSGTTYFGFFTKDTLRRQEGIPGVSPYRQNRAGPALALHSLVPGANAEWSMLDTIRHFSFDQSNRGSGEIVGVSGVDARRWYFASHFHQDPVWPGSLGLEAFLQVVRAYATLAWPRCRSAAYALPLTETTHEWTYRGQILRGQSEVVVRAEIADHDSAVQRLTASGFLYVDGLPIYQMKGFQLRLG